LGGSEYLTERGERFGEQRAVVCDREKVRPYGEALERRHLDPAAERRPGGRAVSWLLFRP
jgi:hypothetical protein